MSNIFETTKQVPFDDDSKIVLMSDCHRGDCGQADEFLKNRPMYQAALIHYFNKQYTYMEIGDGDELWENKNYYELIHANSDVFKLLSSFYKDNRLYFIYGNHDMEKRQPSYVQKHLYHYYSEHEKRSFPLFEDIKIYEGIVLCHKNRNEKIFLVHGHQVDFLNYDLWKLARLLVRYLWRPLNLYGVNDPTRTAKNYSRKEKIDRRLMEWVRDQKQMLIAGHTHRPIFAEIGQLPYFNAGSSVHPSCITALEIAHGSIRLVKWSMKANEDGVLYVGRDILAGPNRISEYFYG